MSNTPNTKQRFQSDYTHRIGAYRDPRGHLVHYDENNSPIPNDPQTGKPMLKPGQRDIGQSPIHTMAQNEGIKPFTPFGGAPSPRVAFGLSDQAAEATATIQTSPSSGKASSPLPTAQQSNSELAYVPKQSITQRSLSMIPDATMERLAAQKAQATQAQQPMQAGVMPINPQYAAPGGDQFARVTSGGAPLATAGRIVDDTGDRTAQFAAGGSGSSQLAAQAQSASQVFRPKLDLNIQHELVKQYPNIGIGGHQDNQAFLNAYTKSYDPNKPMTRDQVFALTGGLFPAPKVNIASTKLDLVKTGLFNHPEIKPNPEATLQPSLLDDFVNSFTGTPYGQSAINNGLSRITGAGGLKNPSGLMFPSDPMPSSTPFNPDGAKIDLGGLTAQSPTQVPAGGFELSNPSGPSIAGMTPVRMRIDPIGNGSIANPNPMALSQPERNIVVTRKPDWTGNADSPSAVNGQAPFAFPNKSTTSAQPAKPASTAQQQAEEELKKKKQQTANPAPGVPPQAFNSSNGTEFPYV